MPDFAHFDQRRYRTLSVVDGYRQWAGSYEDSVEDEMDLGLLERLESVPWAACGRVVDLGCGTGRTAAWLRAKGVAHIDGVDATPAMLDAARKKALHDRLVEGDVRATGLDTAAYDLVVCSLVDEHLPDLATLYLEARRLLGGPGDRFVLVGYHPFFIMAAGMPTHFDGEDGQPVAIETHVHLFSDHMNAALAAGFAAVELHEAVVDQEWIRRKPRWDRFREWPISFVWTWAAVA
ncbi:MAG: class I SAM-dependent methyltransferase [Actinobacteria bacterium]|nr:class I SAM-dependent methyltransferase [Actinomycetota bacterium]